MRPHRQPLNDFVTALRRGKCPLISSYSLPHLARTVCSYLRTIIPILPVTVSRMNLVDISGVITWPTSLSCVADTQHTPGFVRQCRPMTMTLSTLPISPHGPLERCSHSEQLYGTVSVSFPAMFSAIPQKNRAAATTYFDEHLSHNDYYTQGEDLTHDQGGHWIGIGAGRLGLQPGQAVTRDVFLRLCDNSHPMTGELLTPQQFRDRRLYFDFVCSPPKSVSILAVTMNDHRIIEAHREASTMAVRELEQFAATRIRKAGIEDRDRTTGNLVGAAFLHTTSRALDPQLPRTLSCSTVPGTTPRSGGRRCKPAICSDHALRHGRLS